MDTSIEKLDVIILRLNTMNVFNLEMEWNGLKLSSTFLNERSGTVVL